MKVKNNKLTRFWRRLKNYEIAVFLAGVHYAISTPITAVFFTPEDDEISKRNRIIINILFFGVLFLMYWGIIFLIRHRREYKRQICFGCIYFIILMIFLALTWPGIWRGPNDEFIIALQAKSYMFYGWHHFLTSILFMIAFRFIPIFSSVIVVQCVLITIMTTYIYYGIIDYFNLTKRFSKVLLAVPFFLPAVIDNALYPIRAILYSYIVILLIFMMLQCYLRRHITMPQLIVLIAAFILSATWRSEGVYYVLVAIIFFGFFAIKKYTSLRLTVFSVVITIVGTLFVNSVQNSTMSIYQQRSYKILATANIAKTLIERAYMDNPDAPELTSIDNILDVDYINSHPNETGENAFWEGAYKDDYSEDDYNKYLKAVISLAFKYPQSVIKSNLLLFLRIDSVFVLNNATNYTEYFDESIAESRLSDLGDDMTEENIKSMLEFYENAKTFVETGGELMMPISSELRAFVIKLLEGRSLSKYTEINVIGSFGWTLIIPMFVTITTLIFLIVKKKFGVAIIIGTIVIKTFIVFMLSPLPLHMYYYAEYLVGYIILFTTLALIATKFSLPRFKKQINSYKIN